LPGAENDIVPGGKGLCINGLSGLSGFCPGMHAHLAEISAEAGFEIGPRGLRQRLTAAPEIINIGFDTRGNRWGWTLILAGLNGLFLFFGFGLCLSLHQWCYLTGQGCGLPLDALSLFTLRAVSLTPDRVPVWHAHNLISQAVGFFFVYIPGPADFKAGLQHPGSY
jgi:hypothetical protein